MEDTSREDDITSEQIEEELKTLIEYIERHHRWSRIEHSVGLNRLNMVATESLIEAAEFVRTLCEKVSSGLAHGKQEPGDTP